MSVIVSSKTKTVGHQLRLQLVRKLKAELGNQIDVFGSGINHIADKWDGIAPYEYHLVLENSQVTDYWSEKLSDCFLGYSFPIYVGCPNINEYFSPNSLICVDIHNMSQAVNRIQEIINEPVSPTRMKAVAEARKLILDKYQFFPFIVNTISRLHLDINEPKELIYIQPETAYNQPGMLTKIKRILQA